MKRQSRPLVISKAPHRRLKIPAQDVLLAYAAIAPIDRAALGPLNHDAGGMCICAHPLQSRRTASWWALTMRGYGHARRKSNPASVAVPPNACAGFGAIGVCRSGSDAAIHAPGVCGRPRSGSDGADGTRTSAGHAGRLAGAGHS